MRKLAVKLVVALVLASGAFLWPAFDNSHAGWDCWLAPQGGSIAGWGSDKTVPPMWLVACQ